MQYNMYVNRKMRLVETVLGIGGGKKRRRMERMNSGMIYCKNFCKCHNVSPAQQ
jgi:hypothetical protein